MATWDESLLLFLERSGYVEETYHTFSYSPLADDEATSSRACSAWSRRTPRRSSPPGGWRRSATSARAAPAHLTEAETIALRVPAPRGEPVGRCRSRWPTSSRPTDDRARLAASTGFTGDAPGRAGADRRSATPRRRGPPAELIRGEAVHGRRPRGPVRRAAHRGVGPSPPRPAVVVPARRSRGSRAPYGFLVVGANRYRPLDERLPRLPASWSPGTSPAALTDARAYEFERPAGGDAGRARPGQDRLLHQRQPRVPHPADPAAGPAEDALADDAEPLPAGQRAPGRAGPAQRPAAAEAGQHACWTSPGSSPAQVGSRLRAGRPRALHRRAGRRCSRSAVERPGCGSPSTARRCPSRCTSTGTMWAKIVLNLLSNALKFTFEGGVTVRLARGRTGAVLTVTDTGTGIPAAELPHLFERFHRVSGARSRTHEGSGIGLALVSELVAAARRRRRRASSVLGAGQHLHRAAPLRPPTTCPPTRSRDRPGRSAAPATVAAAAEGFAGRGDPRGRAAWTPSSPRPTSRRRSRDDRPSRRDAGRRRQRRHARLHRRPARQDYDVHTPWTAPDGAGAGPASWSGPGADRRDDAAPGRLRAARGAAGRPAHDRHARSSCCPPAPARRAPSRGWRPAPTTTWSSRSPPASCWPGCASTSSSTATAGVRGAAGAQPDAARPGPAARPGRQLGGRPGRRTRWGLRRVLADHRVAAAEEFERLAYSGVVDAPRSTPTTGRSSAARPAPEPRSAPLVEYEVRIVPAPGRRPAGLGVRGEVVETSAAAARRCAARSRTSPSSAGPSRRWPPRRPQREAAAREHSIADELQRSLLPRAVLRPRAPRRRHLLPGRRRGHPGRRRLVRRHRARRRPHRAGRRRRDGPRGQRGGR